MKKIILSLGLAAFMLSSCDEISEKDYLQSLQNGGDSTQTLTRKVLLEDYTGHQCGNCPTAAEIAKNIEDTYGDNVVVMGVHAGYFASVQSSGKYTTDYRNATSNELDNIFGISTAGNPNGMVNRKNYPSNGHIKKPDAWLSEISPLIGNPAIAKLDLTLAYNPSTRVITINNETEFVQEYTGKTHLAFYVLEDSLVSYQKDYRLDDKDIPNYVHRHVLRGSANGTMGESLSTASIISGTKFTTSKSYSIPAQYNEKHISIVAVLMDSETFEVLQVEEKHNP